MMEVNRKVNLEWMQLLVLFVVFAQIVFGTNEDVERSIDVINRAEGKFGQLLDKKPHIVMLFVAK